MAALQPRPELPHAARQIPAVQGLKRFAAVKPEAVQGRQQKQVFLRQHLRRVAPGQERPLHLREFPRHRHTPLLIIPGAALYQRQGNGLDPAQRLGVRAGGVGLKHQPPQNPRFRRQPCRQTIHLLQLQRLVRKGKPHPAVQRVGQGGGGQLVPPFHGGQVPFQLRRAAGGQHGGGAAQVALPRQGKQHRIGRTAEALPLRLLFQVIGGEPVGGGGQEGPPGRVLLPQPRPIAQQQGFRVLFGERVVVLQHQGQICRPLPVQRVRPHPLQRRPRPVELALLHIRARQQNPRRHLPQGGRGAEMAEQQPPKIPLPRAVLRQKLQVALPGADTAPVLLLLAPVAEGGIIYVDAGEHRVREQLMRQLDPFLQLREAPIQRRAHRGAEQRLPKALPARLFLPHQGDAPPRHVQKVPLSAAGIQIFPQGA